MKLPAEMSQAYLQRRKADMVLLEEAAEDGGYEYIAAVSRQMIRMADGYGFPELVVLAKDLLQATDSMSSTKVESALSKIKQYVESRSQ